MTDAPRWKSADDDGTSTVVSCFQGHLASREVFEDVGGCPYCLHTPGERQAALRAKQATERRMRSAA